MIFPIKKQVHFVPHKESARVSEILLSHFKLTQEHAISLLELGAIYKNKNRIQADEVVNPGEHLQIYLHPARYPVSEISWKKTIVFQNSECCVINKPSGIPVHSTSDNLVENVLYQLRKVVGQDLWVTHRLDAGVSGLMVLAKTSRFQSFFNERLVQKKVKKRYVALVERPPKLGKVLHFMEPGEKVPKKLLESKESGWLECSLEILKVEPIVLQEKEFYQCEILLNTGRTHQIRAQLSYSGSPILGDKMYRGRNRAGFTKNRLALHASELEWTDTLGLHRFHVPPSF